MNDITLTFRTFGERPAPFTDALFDVEIVNSANASRWFLLPLYLDSATLGPLLASSVEITELSGTGRVRIARFLGNGSFQALLVASGLRVMVRNLPITLVDGPPATDLAVPLMIAEGLRIGEQPAEDWFKVDLQSSSDADVTFKPGAIVASQDTPGVQAVPVSISGGRVCATCVRLNRR